MNQHCGYWWSGAAALRTDYVPMHFWLSSVTIYRPSFPGMGIPMLKIRRSPDRLIFNMGIPLLVRWHLYIETAPWVMANAHHIVNDIFRYILWNWNYNILLKILLKLAPKGKIGYKCELAQVMVMIFFLKFHVTAFEVTYFFLQLYIQVWYDGSIIKCTVNSLI